MSRRWIFLRGLSRGVGHWGDFIQLFQSRFPQDQIELIDIPGNGLRYKEKSPLTILEIMKQMRSQSQFILDGPVYIFAISLGAMVATEWARQYPSEIKKMFLINTSSANTKNPFLRFKPHNYLHILETFFHTKIEEREDIISQMIMNNEERRRQVLSSLAAHSSECPISRKNVMHQLWAASQYFFPESKPCDVELWGAWKDQLVSSQCTSQIAQMWGVEPVMHPWAGHDIPLDDPEWALNRLQDL